MNYYRIIDDLEKPKKRWFLGSINFEGEWDFWHYVSPGKVEIPARELFINIRRKGLQLDFTMADFELLIVNEKVKNLISENEVQFIPLKITDSALELFLMVVNNEIACVDENKSVFNKWQKDDPIRPDKAGQYKSFDEMIINPNLIPNNNNIFRLENYDVVVVISETLKDKLEENKVSGVKYEKIN